MENNDWLERMPELKECYPTLVQNVRFAPGKVLLTAGAVELLQANEDCDIRDYLIRHVTGDWGDLDAHDRRVNEEAIRNDQRLLSSYTLPDGKALWLITDADRSRTTALTPQEY